MKTISYAIEGWYRHNGGRYLWMTWKSGFTSLELAKQAEALANELGLKTRIVKVSRELVE